MTGFSLMNLDFQSMGMPMYMNQLIKIQIVGTEE